MDVVTWEDCKNKIADPDFGRNEDKANVFMASKLMRQATPAYIYQHLHGHVFRYSRRLHIPEECRSCRKALLGERSQEEDHVLRCQDERKARWQSHAPGQGTRDPRRDHSRSRRQEYRTRDSPLLWTSGRDHDAALGAVIYYRTTIESTLYAGWVQRLQNIIGDVQRDITG